MDLKKISKTAAILAVATSLVGNPAQAQLALGPSTSISTGWYSIGRIAVDLGGKSWQLMKGPLMSLFLKTALQIAIQEFAGPQRLPPPRMARLPAPREEDFYLQSW